MQIPPKDVGSLRFSRGYAQCPAGESRLNGLPLRWYAIGSPQAMAMRKQTWARLVRGLRGGAAMLLFGRRMLEGWAKHYLTHKLSEMPNVEASFAEVELNVFQGLAVLRGVSIAKVSGGQRVLEARCREISIDIQWRELLRGVLVGRARLREPHIQILADQERDGDGKPPIDALLGLCRETQRFMPFHLRSLEISEGCIEYHSQFTSPPFRLVLDRVSLSATNVTNMADGAGGAATAHVFAEGRTTGDGRFWMRLNLPSLVHTLTFDLQAGVNRVNLVDLNDVLRAYAKFDLRRGVCSIYSEFKVENGHYQGFIQPHLTDLDVFAWQKEHGKSFLQICRQTAIAFLANLFKNKPRDELALTIPISGTFADADLDLWSAVGSLLRNTFVHSLLARPVDSQPGVAPKRWSRPRLWGRSPAPC